MKEFKTISYSSSNDEWRVRTYCNDTLLKLEIYENISGKLGNLIEKIEYTDLSIIRQSVVLNNALSSSN